MWKWSRHTTRRRQSTSAAAWVRHDGRQVRLFNAEMEQIASHTRIEPGRYSSVRGVRGLDHAGSVQNTMLNRYLKPELLIVNDMDMKALPQNGAELLLEIIVRRNGLLSTLMTSNRPIDEWGQLLGDLPAAGAILDRLLHQAEIIVIEGRSHRLAQGAARQASAAANQSRTARPSKRSSTPE